MVGVGGEVESSWIGRHGWMEGWGRWKLVALRFVLLSALELMVVLVRESCRDVEAGGGTRSKMVVTSSVFVPRQARCPEVFQVEPSL